MKPRNPALRSLAVAFVLLSQTVLHAEDGSEPRSDGKIVHLVWFPRFSPDGKWLVTAHGSWNAPEGGEVRVWDAETGEPKFTIATDRGVRTVAWAPKGKSFVSGDWGGMLSFYDAETGQRTAEIKLPANVEVLQFSPDGQRLIAAVGNGSVHVYELPSKKELHTWKKLHRKGIWGMAISPDGKTLCTCGQDRLAHLLDMENFEVLHNLQHPADLNGAAFTIDNKYVLTGCSDSAIRVFDVETGDEVRRLLGHNRGSVTDLCFSPDGKQLVSCGMDRSVRIWDVNDIKQPKLTDTLDGSNEMVFGVAISPNGKRLAFGGWDDEIKVLDLGTKEEVWSWRR
ncbi:MAG TPA: WD40 repeat domain-containing protein [Pirellulales bacterium]|nr:WD40 repeat domain-containing protein [Pirellulales bacterium]